MGMSSICFDCKNAMGNRCEKIRTGLPIEGWKAKETSWGYAVKACPNFRFDYEGYQKVKVIDLCKTINLSIKTFRNVDFKYVKKVARENGYLVIRVLSENEKRHWYYIKQEGL